jgi:hypothetical protein
MGIRRTMAGGLTVGKKLAAARSERGRSKGPFETRIIGVAWSLGLPFEAADELR